MIDAHLHLWDPKQLTYGWLRDVPSISGAHTPDDWARGSYGVDRAIFVQADCAPEQALDEVDWVAGLASPALRILAVVAYAPLERGTAVQPHLDALRARPIVRGVRRSVQNGPDDFILDPDHLDGLVAAASSGLTIDVCARARQLPLVIETLSALFDRVPAARVVIDHLGKPDIARHGANIAGDGWAEALRTLAAMLGISAKISGLVTEDDWTTHRPDVLGRYIDHAIDAFGPERLMFGGDWPVVDLAGGYHPWLATFEQTISRLSQSDQDAIRTTTALKFYAPADPSVAPKDLPS